MSDRPGRVGMPATLLLNAFGSMVWDAFGEIPYHVGSSLDGTKEARDVDVRLILGDEDYAAMGFGDPEHSHQNARWVAFTLAFSALGKQMTGLPIDFQIQQQTQANALFGRDEHRRSAIGLVPHRYERLRSNTESEGAEP